MTCEDIRNATSLPEVDSGPLQQDLLAGLTTENSGPARVRVSRSARPAKGSEPMMQGICGRTFIASSVPPGPLSSWESRLRERLGTVGSTESALIWREKPTPAGQLISRLAPSTLHTNGTDCIGSRWPTATSEVSGDTMDTHEARQTRVVAKHGRRMGTPLNVHMLHAAYSATPTAHERTSMPRQVDHGQQLANQMVAYSPTPTVADVMGGRKSRSGNRNNEPLLNGLMFAQAATALGGPMPNGSSAPSTAKRGAPNPAFPFWLMGFPDEWTSGALAAMRSHQFSRRKSSRRSSTPKLA